MENNGLVIQKADKGNTVVLCDKDAYIDRVKELISDGTKFTNLNKLPTEWLSFVLKSEQKIRKAHSVEFSLTFSVFCQSNIKLLLSLHCYFAAFICHHLQPFSIKK